MKPTEHGGLKFESPEELEVTISAIDDVLSRTEGNPEHEADRDMFWRLQQALHLKTLEEPNNSDASKPPPFKCYLDSTLTEYALTALRIASRTHSNPEVTEQASVMITDYAMRVLEAEMRDLPSDE